MHDGYFLEIILWSRRAPNAAEIHQKNPRAHKNKIGTPPPHPPPPQNAEFYGHGPRIADANFTDTRIFLNSERTKVTQKWLKSDSGRLTAKWPKIDSKVTPNPIFEWLLSHLNSLWGGTLGVIFESLLGHFNSFCVSVELGARPLHKIKKRENNTCELHVENYGSYMRIIPQHVSGHVRDTCMKFLGINKCKCYMLVTCRKVSELKMHYFRPQWYS